MSWFTIEGLHPHEREAGQRALPNLNLAVVELFDTVLSGVHLPDIVYGRVRRRRRSNIDGVTEKLGPDSPGEDVARTPGG